MSKNQAARPSIERTMNVLGWGAPGLLMGLMVLLIGLFIMPLLTALGIALLVCLVLAAVGYRRRRETSMQLDCSGVHVRWRSMKVDVTWAQVLAVKGATMWFEPAAVLGRPPGEIPTDVRRAVVAGKAPRLRLLTFTRSLTQGDVGAVVAAYRPDLVAVPTGSTDSTARHDGPESED